MSDSFSNTFSFKRSQHFIHQFLITHRRMLLVGLVVLPSVALLFGLLMVIESSVMGLKPVSSLMVTLPTQIYVLLGTGLSSVLFYGIHKPESSAQYLSIPVSVAERLTAAVLISLVGYTIFMYSVLFSYIFIIGIEMSENVLYSYFSDFQAYLVLQCVFIYGAAFFRKNQFISTFVAVIIVGLGFTSLLLTLNSLEIMNPARFRSFFGWPWSTPVLAFMSNLIICALFLMLTYFRLKKHEVA